MLHFCKQTLFVLHNDSSMNDSRQKGFILIHTNSDSFLNHSLLMVKVLEALDSIHVELTPFESCGYTYKALYSIFCAYFISI